MGRMSRYTQVATPAGTDEFAINQGGITYKETLDQINIYVGGDGVSVIHVGKHGADTNDGTNQGKAKLTFAGARTQIVANADAAADHRYVIWCQDAGQYIENLVGLAYVDIWAPRATINPVATHTFVDDVAWRIGRVTVGTGLVGFTKTAGADHARLRLSYLDCEGTAGGFLVTSGGITLDIRQVDVENGYGIGAAGTTGELDGRITSISISGTGIGLGTVAIGAVFDLRVGCIDDAGAGTGILIGNVASTINIISGRVACNTAYNIGAAATLKGICANLIGARTGNADLVAVGVDIENTPIGQTRAAAGTFTKVVSGTVTVTVVGPTDDLDVSAVNVVFIDTNSNNVTIGGFTGGVSGQRIMVVVIDATNNTILEHAEGTGNQDIYLSGGNDKTIVAAYGGWILECDGTHWYEGGNTFDPAVPGAIGGTTPAAGSFTDLAGTFKAYPPAIPIEWGLDGASPPDAAITVTDTFKIAVREFRGAVGNQDLYIPERAAKDLTGGTIKFKVSGYVTDAVAPATGETVIFTLAGSARAPSEPLSKAMGAAVSATFTADASYVQYDEWETVWSGDVTITDLAADRAIMLQLIRDQATDTYAEKIGVAFIEIEFTRTVGN